MRVELLGGMGVGKTTLCNVLEELGYNCIYEDLNQNPFMDDFYKDSDQYKLPSQMWLILSKYVEIQQKLKPSQINVLDQALYNYKAYSNMLFANGSDNCGFKIVQDFFDYTEQRFGQPDLLVYLQVSSEVQLKRIKERGRQFERSVTLEYLQDLKENIEIIVAEAKEKSINVVEIDTEEIFMHQHYVFAKDLAEDIASRLNFCVVLDKEN